MVVPCHLRYFRRNSQMSEGLFPVSFAQQRLWFLNELEPGNGVYSLPRLIRITGRLNAGALTGAIRALVSRHEGLRTVFTSIEGEPWQSVQPEMPLEISSIDLRQLSPADRDKEALRIAREETRKPFDLQSGPLLRVRLIRLDHEEHFLLLVMHHIVTDGWSMDILFREMADLYESMTEGRTCELPPLTSRYRDYGRWQRELVSGELLA